MISRKIFGLLLTFMFFPSLAHASTLKIATYNMGMLDAFGAVPYLNERQAHLKSEILKNLKAHDIDVLAVQEMYTSESEKVLRSIGEGYQFLTTGGDAWIPLFVDHPTGMAFIVKKSLGGQIAFKDFQLRESSACGYGQVCDKGLLELSLKIEDKKVLIFNTHMSSSYKRRDFREKQIKEIGDRIQSLVSEYDVFVLTGDLNYSPVFGKLRSTDSGSLDDFQKNAKLYDLFFNQFGKSLECEDSYPGALSKPKYQYTYDRETNLLPLKNPSSSYEPSQRVDHIFLCGKTKSWQVIQNKQVFNEAIVVEKLGHPIHLSDHFGVLAEIQIK